MEDLNKTQLVLLALLVSFVTSIATGIMTVSLLQEAPSNVTQTINRVVEKTIERVVPVEEGGTETIKEVTTVVVKEEDLVIDAINKNSKSLVRIRDNALIDGVSPLYGIGFLISNEGIVASARRDSLNNSSTYTGTFPDGSSFTMRVAGTDDAGNIAFFRIIKDQNTKLPAGPVKVSDNSLQLGQTVIAIEGQDKDVVSIGRITSFVFADTSSILRTNTDIISKTQIVGGPLINLSGEIVGIRVGAAEGAFSSFISQSLLKQAIAKAPK